MRRIAEYFLGVIIVGMVAACSADPEAAKPDQDYMPLHKGFYQIYQVDETIYTASDDPQDLHYELMTEVVDSFLNAGNTYTYVLYRSKRDNDTEEWQYVDTWSVKQDNIRLVISEESTAYVKLSFPLKNGRVWDGNAFNSAEEDEYELENAGKPFTAGEITFDDCVEVNQNDNQDFIVYQDKRSEVYARGVGLVYKEVLQLHYCTTGCQQLQQIETGIASTQTIKEYGTR